MMKRMATKIMVEVIIIACATTAIISFYAFWVSIHPPRWPVTKTPADYGMEYEQVKFQSTDGITLHGWFVPAQQESSSTIIMMHGYPASKSDIVNLGVFLHDTFNLFFFDFRYMGESEGNYTTAGASEVWDLAGAVLYLEQNKTSQSEFFGCWGFSLGGAVGLMGAETIHSIRAVVADSSYATLGSMVDGLFARYSFIRVPFVLSTKLWARIALGIKVDEIAPMQSISRRPIPILLIHGKDDKEISYVNSVQIHDAAVGPKELWLIDGVGHGGAYFFNQQQYEKKVLTFFTQYL